MSLNPIEQFKKLLFSAKKVLILLPQNPNGDTISASWSFYFFLKENSIEATIAADDYQNNKSKFSFLPTPDDIRDNILGSRDFILSFNTKYNKINNVRTEQKENETLIYITPEKGRVDPRDFSFIPAKFKYDLVVCIGSPDKESFGKIFEENPDIFYEVPIINIDNHNNNDNFGQINIIEMTSSSVSEMLFNIFNEIKEKPLTETISKCLLTGIISATNSYQNNKTTPKSLQISSQLMQEGVNQQEIIRHLYKTHPFNLLKLWGRVMSKLNWDPELKLVWSLVSIEDFVQSRSEPKDIPFILDKIQNSYESGEIFLILYNKSPDKIKGVMRFSNPELLNKINSFENGKIIGDIYEFEIENTNIQDSERRVLEKVRDLLTTK